MGTQRYLATGSDGRAYTVLRIGSSIRTTSLDSTTHSLEEGLVRWVLENGDALNPTRDPKVFKHFADPNLSITLK